MLNFESVVIDRANDPVPDFLFETARLRCRRWLDEDFDALYEVYSDAEAMRWVGDGQPITRADCEEWFRVTRANYGRRGYGMFTLLQRCGGEVVGFAGLVHPGGQPEAEVKYALRRQYWGGGLATEAVAALLDHGASQHGLRRIIATVASDNVASQRVLAKVSMALAQQRRNDDGSITLIYEWRPASAGTV